jgi:hypothetical protein
MYVCADDAKDAKEHCTSEDDQKFVTALDAMRGNKKMMKGKVGRALAAYGKLGDAGVTVTAGGSAGETQSWVQKDESGHYQAISLVTINVNANAASLDAAVGHEGTHVADAQAVVASGITPDGDKLYAGQNITPYQSEQNAYDVTNSILTMENSHLGYYCGMSDCSLGTTVVGPLPSTTVDRIVSSNPQYNQGGNPMSSTNQGVSVVNGVAGTVPH